MHAFVEPLLGDQRVSITPSLGDSVLKPVGLEVRMVEHENL